MSHSDWQTFLYSLPAAAVVLVALWAVIALLFAVAG